MFEGHKTISWGFRRFKCEKNKKGDAKDIKINRMNRYHLDKDIPRRWNI